MENMPGIQGKEGPENRFGIFNILSFIVASLWSYF